MKRIAFFAASVAALFFAVSCNKQEIPGEPETPEEVKFIATIDDDITKTALSTGGRVFWQETDKVYINGSEFRVRPLEPATTAELVLSPKEKVPQPPYRAHYFIPTENGKKFFYQNHDHFYQEGRFNVPMYACSNDEHLSFKNICGVICLHLKGTDEVIDITVTTTGERIWGDFDINESDYSVRMDPETLTDGKTAQISMAAIQLDENNAKEFYFYLPPNNYAAGVSFKVKTLEGKTYVKTTRKTMGIERNRVYNIEWKLGDDQEHIPPYCVHGKFTVNGSGKQVYFTGGNLYYTDEVHGRDYRIESPQCDFPKNWDSHHIGHFFWSKDAAKARADYYHDAECSASDVLFTNSTPTTPNPNFTVEGDQTGIFRVLSDDEWNYLLRERNVNGGTGKGHSYSIEKDITIEGKACHGVVIFPDGFTKQSSWKSEYTTWAAIFNAGIVFLPLAGYRDKDDIGEPRVELNKCDKWALYMSSKAKGSESALGGLFYYDEDDLRTTDYDDCRNFGYTFRLVRDR